MSRTASQFNVSVEAPDLSRVLPQARQMGRNTAYSDFYEELKKKEEERAKAAEKAEKEETEAAKQDLSNEPESPGFWSKLGQGSLDGAMRVIDILSRPNYAIANAVLHDNQQDESIWEDLTSIDLGAAKAAWEGFAGREKTTFAQVLANRADDGVTDWQDNKWYQGIAGFGLDVMLDPTTYLGIGLVTKPLRKSTRELSARFAETDAKAKDLAQNIAKLPPVGDDVPEGIPGLNAEEIYGIITQRPMANAKNQPLMSRSAQKATRVRNYIHDVDKLKKDILKRSDMPDSVKVDYARQIDDLRAQYTKALNDYGKHAYNRALKSYKASDAAVATATKSFSSGKAADAFGAMARSMSKIRKTDKKAPTDYETFFKALPEFDELPLPREVKEQILDTSWRMAQADPQYQALRERINAARGIGRAAASENNALVDVGRVGTAKNTASQIKRNQGAISRYYRRQQLIQADYFMKAVRHHLGDDSFTARVTDLDTKLERKAALEARLKDNEISLANPEQAVKTTSDLDSPNLNQQSALDAQGRVDPNAARPDSTTFDETRQLQDELDQLNREIEQEMFGGDTFAKIPDEIDPKEFKLTNGWIAANQDTEFGRIVKNAVDDKTEVLLESKKASFIRRRSEKAAGKNLPGKGDADIEKMFGSDPKKSKGPVPAIFVDGQKILKTDKKSLQKLVTDADRKAYREAAEKADNKSLPSEADEFGNLNTPNATTIGDVAKSMEAPKTGFTNPDLEYRAFDRIFNDQWGMSVKEANAWRLEAEGKAIPVGKFSPGGEEYPITKVEFKDTVINNPNDVAIGFFAWNIPINGKMTSWNQFKAKGGKANQWRAEFKDWVQANKDKPGFNETLAKTWDKGHYKYSKVREESGKIADRPARIPDDEVAKLRADARKEAMKDVEADVKRGRLKYIPEDEIKFEADPKALQKSHQDAVDVARIEHAEAVRQLKMQNPRGNSKPAQLRQQIKQLEIERDVKIAQLEKAHKEAIATREAMAERLDEQLLLDLLADPIDNAGKALKVSFGGMKLAEFSSPRALTAATEKIGGLPILQKTAQIWADAFRPSSRMSPELNAARLRAQGNVNDVLKHHLDEVFHAFNKYTPQKRKAALQSVIKGVPVGVDEELYKVTEKFFSDTLPYLNESIKVGEDPLRIMEVNKYLDDEFHLVMPDGSDLTRGTTITSIPQMFKYMGRLKPDTDPMKVLWSLRIAGEKALAEKGMKHTIAEAFGIRRIIPNDFKGEINEGLIEKRNLIEALKEKHQWTTVDGFHEKYLFAPEAAKEINKLMDMMKPERTQDIVRLYDKALRAWKSTVTIYNPGYYTRNGIGEVMMGLFDGVTDPRWYTKASQVIKHAMPDEVNEVLKSVTPWKQYKSQGGRTIIKTGRGKELTIEDVWVLYHEQNLKSGFISTEFDHYFPAGNTARSTSVGQFATKINDSMRQAGEKYEDFFRVAHFMNRLSRSKHKNVEDAAREAAEYVRKYHFDYTDFTPFEKTKMMRLIPFYKWTRKAMPLMAGMLFTNPAKVNLYPKFMQNMSYATGGTDPLTDQTGFVPDYEEVTPQWMKNLMSYPMGEPDAEGAQNYMRVATPQFDIYSMMQNPFSATWGMITPFAKVPIEQGAGQTLDPEFNMKLEDGQDRKEHLMRTTPAGSFINNIIKNSGEGDSALLEPDVEGRHFPTYDERLTSFITGLGFYENNEARQKGEEFRRNMEK